MSRIAGFFVCSCLLIEFSAAADPPVPRRSFATREDALSYFKERRQANEKLFRETFEKANSLSVRARLERAAFATGELIALAERIQDKNTADQMAQGGYTSRVPIYPRESHLVRLLSERPWLRDNPESHEMAQLRIDSEDLQWPTEKDQGELRRLLADNDPDIQAMAIEALASLHDPADLLLIARVAPEMRMFAGGTPTVPVIQTQHPIWANGWPGAFSDEDDPLILGTYWRQATTADHVDRALRLMTGANVNRSTFPAWVATHGATRDSLWYWQQYLQRRFDRMERSLHRQIQDDSNNYDRLLEARSAELRESLRAELAQMDRQVEAKVILLTQHRQSGTEDINNPIQRFFDPPWKTRLTKEELFDLLEGKRPWQDADWVDANGDSRGIHNRLVMRIMLGATNSFTREDVPRLQGLLDQRANRFWKTGRAAWIIGISRLLPPAAPGNLDDPQTCDGFLRQGLAREHDVSVRNYLAAELVRVAAARNSTFLEELYFDIVDNKIDTDGRTMLLRELGQPPLSDDKCQLLLKILVDVRCRPILAPPVRKFGDDLPRQAALRSVNAYAGRELFSYDDFNLLIDPEKAPAALDRITTALVDYQKQRNAKQ